MRFFGSTAGAPCSSESACKWRAVKAATAPKPPTPVNKAGPSLPMPPAPKPPTPTPSEGDDVESDSDDGSSVGGESAVSEKSSGAVFAGAMGNGSRPSSAGSTGSKKRRRGSGTTGALGAAAAAAALAEAGGEEDGETLGAIRNATANVSAAGPQNVLLQHATVIKSIRKGTESMKQPLDEALDRGTNSALGQAIVDVNVIDTAYQTACCVLDNFDDGGNLVSTAGADSSTHRLRRLVGELVEDRGVAFEEDDE